MDGGHAPLDLPGIYHRPVGGTGAHHNEQVRPGQGLVGTVIAVGADHAHIQRMVGWHQANAHHGLDHRDGTALSQLQQLSAGISQPHAAAGTDEGLAGAGDGLYHPLDLQIVALDAGLIAPDVHLFGVVKALQVLLLHVNGNINENRTGPAGGGDVEGLLHHPGDVVGVFDQVAVLGEGGHRAGDVHLLEDIPAQQVAGHLAGDGHHGDGVHVGRSNAGNQIGGARAAGHHAHAHLAADAGIAGSHMARILLRPYQSICDLRVFLQGIHRRADGRSGVAKHMGHALPQQTFNQCLRSIHFTVTSAFLSKSKSGHILSTDRTKPLNSVVPPNFAPFPCLARTLSPDNGGHPTPPSRQNYRSAEWLAGEFQL